MKSTEQIDANGFLSEHRSTQTFLGYQKLLGLRMETAMSRYARVVQAHKDPCPDPISGKEGDVFLLGGRHSADYADFVWAIAADDRCGWIPRAILQESGDFGRLVRDYTTQEVTVAMGEVVEILEQIGGWLWIATHDGREGWIPTKSVTYLRDRTRLASTR